MHQNNVNDDGPRFAPPTEPSVMPPPPEHSSWPGVLGIIAIVFGGLGILGALWGLVGQQFIQNTGLAGVPGREAISQVMEDWKSWLLVQSGLSGLIAMLLLFAGIGLVRQKPSGVSQAKVWAVAKLVFAFIVVYVQMKSQPHAMRAVFESTAGPGPQVSDAMLQLLVVAGAAITIIWLAALPVFVLIWFARGKIKREVAGWGTPAREV